MDPQTPVAPPVVAVVVCRDPGPWFDEVLAGLAAQDYPNLSVLIIDAGSADDPAPRVAAQLPGAFVKRLAENPGYGAAANQALQLVQGAAFLCLLHDDVALAPDAVRLLVEEAFRSNAGVAGPKLVEWDDPARLLSVGAPVDKAGVEAVVLQPGELDQEQHDAVRDVFVVSGACLLVRGDLFAALGGFDPAIEFEGEGLDLCWRAHVAGARVVVVPAARARHRGALAERRPDLRTERLLARHRLRAVLGNYSVVHLVRVLPQVLVLHAVIVVLSLVRARPRAAGDVVHAWRWNLSRLGGLWAKRRAVHAIRQVPDREVRNLQARGSAQFTAFVRGQLERRDDRVHAVQGAGRSLVEALRSGQRRASIATWASIGVLFAVGSRHLLTGGIPVVGELLPYPDRAGTLLGEYLSGWRSAGMGAAAPAPTGFALLALAAVPFVGNLGLARTVLVLGTVVVGLIGMWRLTRALEVQKARVSGLVAYAALPVAWNALAAGRWGALFVFAAVPWMTARVARMTGLAPFGDAGGAAGPGVAARPFVAQVVGLGLVCALVTAWVPLALLVPVVIALGFVAASVIVGGVAGALRGLGGAVLAGFVAVVLHVPWSLDVYRPSGTWSVLGGIEPAAPAGRGLDALLRFDTGPVGATLVLGVLVAAAYAVLAGTGWRLAWAARALVTAMGFLGIAWASDRGWIPRTLGDVEVVLAPAACAVALAVAVGAAAFDLDVRGGRFTWRHPLAGVCTVALAVGALPAFGSVADGRWHLPTSDLQASLGFLRDQQAEGRFRVLWLGDPRAMPVKGWWLSDGLAYATADDGRIDVRNLWPGSPSSATTLVRDALNLAGAGETARLGRLLAPFGVRYVVVPLRPAPAATGAPRYLPPETLLTMLGGQLDLRRIALDDALVVYENSAWLSTRAALGPAAEEASRSAGFAPLVAVDLATVANPPVLADGDRADRGRGPVPAGPVLVSQGSDRRWVLEVDGTSVPRRTAFGWANVFEVPTAGQATLSYRTPVSRPLSVALQALVWLVALRVVWRAAAAAYGDRPAQRRPRRRRRAAAGGPS